MVAEHVDVRADAVELALLAKQLEGAAGALVVAYAGRLAQDVEFVAAMLRQADHPLLVDPIGPRRAVRQHGRDPSQHGKVRPRLDDQRGVPHQQPRSEEHTSELQSLMRISYAVF